MTGRACASSSSSPAACCAARTATIRTPGISRTAPTFRPIRCCAGLATSRRPSAALGGGLTISGGEPMVQLAFTRRIFAGAKEMGLHTAIADLRISGRSRGRRLPVRNRPRPARHQELGSRHLPPGDRPRPRADAALRRTPGFDVESRSGSASRSFPARPTIPPMSTASPASSRR